MRPNSPNIWGKSALFFLDLVNLPSLFYQKFQKFYAPKVPQTIWIALEPPSGLMEETKIKAAFSLGSSPSL